MASPADGSAPTAPAGTAVAAAPESRRKPSQASIVAAAVAGNAMEFYDFVTYAFFAVYIGEAFFPAKEPIISLLLSVAVFGVGFFTRPLGGIVIGAFADRAGRKPAMLLTIGLITVGTLGLALTPNYSAIGIAAPIIIVICRLIQGLALGGEVGPSSSYLIEIAPPGKRGFYGSWQLASQGGASTVAGIIGIILTLLLPHEAMVRWGWRIPFALGILLIPIALYLREHMPESLSKEPADAPAQERPKLGHHTWTVVLSVGLILGGTISTYMAIYMTSYGITTLKLTPVIAMTATVVFGVCTFVFSLVGGWLCDRHGRRWTMLWPRIVLIVLIYPSFYLLIHHPSFGLLTLTTGLIAGLGGISGAPSLVVIPELFPSKIRALGMSLSYAIGVTVFGGTAQAVVTWIIDVTGDPASPAFYVIVATLIMIVAIALIPETGHGRELRD